MLIYTIQRQTKGRPSPCRHSKKININYTENRLTLVVCDTQRFPRTASTAVLETTTISVSFMKSCSLIVLKNFILPCIYSFTLIYILSVKGILEKVILKILLHNCVL